MPKCLECGKQLKNITAKHLSSCSRITVAKYREKHPEQCLVDEDIKKKYSNPKEKNPRWKGGTTYPNVCEDCGGEADYRAKRCRKCSDKKKKSEPNHFKGKKHSQKTKEKMREAAKNRDPSTYKAPPPPSDKVSKHKKEYWSKLSPEERTKKLKKFIKAGQRTNKKSKNTKIEKKISKLLKEKKVAHKKNKQVGSKFVDILIPSQKKIIECYGDYWHCNPSVYGPDYYHKNLKMAAQEKWDKDKKRLDFLRGQGYDIKVLWEKDIKENFDRIEEEIEKWVCST